MFLAYVYLQSYPQSVNAQFLIKSCSVIVKVVLSLYNFSLCQPREHINQAKPKGVKNTDLGPE
jgi:hypothetical protein